MAFCKNKVSYRMYWVFNLIVSRPVPSIYNFDAVLFTGFEYLNYI